MDGGDRGDVARLSLALARGEERTEIVIGAGALDGLPDLLRAHARAHSYAVIADANVAQLYGDAVVEAVGRSGGAARLYGFGAGESAKRPETWIQLLETLAADGHGRDACVVGLGGGVTTDLAGFVAATFLRGVALALVPTSLLAMVDASVGGKGGVDLVAGKNLAGAFWHPRLVVSDPAVLSTLPDAELRAGLAEVVKHGAIADEAAFEALAAGAPALLAREPGPLARVVVDSVRVKMSFVAGDAREHGARAALNFGHTLGHAIERASGYGIAHGPAVAMGMVAESVLGVALGVTRAGTRERLVGALAAVGLPTEVPADLDPGAILEATRRDKKARRGAVRYTLIERVGAVARGAAGAWTHAAPDEAVLEALAAVAGDANDGGDVV